MQDLHLQRGADRGWRGQASASRPARPGPAGNASIARPRRRYLGPHRAEQPTITTSAGNPTKRRSIPVTVTFSETVTGFTLADVVVGNGTASGFAR